MRRRRGPLPQGCAGGIVQVKAQSLKTATALGKCDSSPCAEKSVGRGLERTAEAKSRRFSAASHRVRESRDAFCCTIAKWRVASSPFLLCLSRAVWVPSAGDVGADGCQVDNLLIFLYDVSFLLSKKWRTFAFMNAKGRHTVLGNCFSSWAIHAGNRLRQTINLGCEVCRRMQLSAAVRSHGECVTSCCAAFGAGCCTQNDHQWTF